MLRAMLLFAKFWFGSSVSLCAKMSGKRYSSDVTRAGLRVDAEREELQLLLEGVSGAKTYKQVRVDALKPSCPCRQLQRAVRTNASRGIGQRLTEITGVSKTSLHYLEVRKKPDERGKVKKKMHPFNLISTMIENINAKDEYYFEIGPAAEKANVAASSFINSPEYSEHPLVQETSGTGETIIPGCIYSDGVKVCCDFHPDSLCGIYVTFIHRDVDECAQIFIDTYSCVCVNMWYISNV